MKTKVSMIIMSHLSDVKIEMSFNRETVATRIEFCKYLIMHFPDTSVEIDPEVEFENYLNLMAARVA